MGNHTQFSRGLVLRNQLGLHARPAALFVRTANSFKCDISVNKDGNVIDGKSILGLLMLAAGQGAALTITARGEDAELALEALERLIVEKFGEE